METNMLKETQGKETRARYGALAGERGSAFVISILVLFVLSVLGLALMLTTTTETDISVNYRWGEMAFFNADAGLEYGKNILASYAVMDGDFKNALPPPRGPGTMDAPPGAGPTPPFFRARPPARPGYRRSDSVRLP